MPFPKRGKKVSQNEEEAPQVDETTSQKQGSTSKVSKPMRLTPGDNPNKQAAAHRSDQPRQNVSSETKPVIESIDPVAISISTIAVQGITDTRMPGTPHVGKVFLRLQSFDEITSLVSSTISARSGLLHKRIDLPPLDKMAEFLTPICIAFQLLNTLALNSADGPFRKLRVLRSSALEVPNFLTPLLQSFGNYRTTEGLMTIAAIEQMIPMLIEHALSTYVDIPHVRPLSDYEALDAGITLYQSSHFYDDFADLIEIIYPEIFQPLNLAIAPGIITTVVLDIRTCEVEPALALLDLGTLGTDLNRLLIRAFLRLRELTWDEMATPDAAPFLQALGLVHGSRRPLEQLSDWVSICLPEYQRVCYQAIPTMFQSSLFSPSTGGSAAQLMTIGNDSTVDSSQTSHTYKLSPSSVTFGYILAPCLRVEYKPLYSTFGTYTRYQTMMHVTEKFAVSTLT